MYLAPGRAWQQELESVQSPRLQLHLAAALPAHGLEKRHIET